MHVSVGRLNTPPCCRSCSVRTLSVSVDRCCAAQLRKCVDDLTLGTQDMVIRATLDDNSLELMKMETTLLYTPARCILAAAS